MPPDADGSGAAVAAGLCTTATGKATETTATPARPKRDGGLSPSTPPI